MSPKLLKFLVKQALGISVSVAIGYTIKMERKVENAIDEHFTSSTD